ncbi:hypothetical protein COY16_05025 [Candidatus Roizmanbacteria bacterium CG_4_10_14_0_2_um_filter_39_13]|uniref:Uncharacterized protein n=1 Tax=Candidatus Roizmanbacteria bacterium CG_4_10_14_0_2_um_filter_39_13 TaxID=1974825 RepID=A0A2M7TWS2_9BACT|nr:MAG: hypothetical protein COY16_05025 [Candidatus Roizmanbacteria bacterium CG_4_10_14_0_2_um_filter_39_13]
MKIIKTIGIALFGLVGVYMYIVEIIAFAQWWGLTGIVVSFMIPPLAVIFPFIYWVKEGVFPLTYLTAWIIGLVGAVLAGYASKDD